MVVSPYIKTVSGSDDRDTALIDSTLRGTSLQVPRTVAEARLNGALGGIERESIPGHDILVPDAETELQRVMEHFDRSNAHASRFNALVVLNLDCNLACPYCYKNHFRGRSSMNEATADLLVETILKGPITAGREVLLDFCGGEPLLSIPLIRRIAEPLCDAAIKAGTAFSFNLFTNGTRLTRRVVEELLPFGLAGARITIDGPPDVHNRQRPFLSGTGSFGLIMSNLKDVCGPLKVQLRGNYTRDNYRCFPELLDILEREGITPDKVYMLKFSPVIPVVGEAGQWTFAMGCACSSEQWIVEASLYLREEILKRGWNTPESKLADCMAAFENDLVVAWDGSLHNCPAFMGLDDLKIGNPSHGISDCREPLKMDILKGEECLGCPYLSLCFGGCCFLRRLHAGAINGLGGRKQYLNDVLKRIVRQDIDLRRN
jgi:uncharacterized protein